MEWLLYFKTFYFYFCSGLWDMSSAWSWRPLIWVSIVTILSLHSSDISHWFKTHGFLENPLCAILTAPGLLIPCLSGRHHHSPAALVPVVLSLSGSWTSHVCGYFPLPAHWESCSVTEVPYGSSVPSIVPDREMTDPKGLSVGADRLSGPCGDAWRKPLTLVSVCSPGL